MNEETEEIIAALIGVVAKNQKFLAKTQATVNNLIENLEKQATAIAESNDNTDLRASLEANTKQMGALAKAILATLAKPDRKTMWDFHVERDVTGRISTVSAEPKRDEKVIN